MTLDPNRADKKSVSLILLSGLGLLGTLSSASGLLLIGLLSAAQSGSFGADSLPYFSLAWISGLVCALLVPSIYYSLKKISGMQPGLLEPAPFHNRFLHLIPWIWISIVVCGELIISQETLLSIVFPPFQLLAVGLPIFVFVETIRTRLDFGSPQRTWGLVSINLLVTPPLVIMAEMLALGILALGCVFWIASQPELIQMFRLSARQLADSAMDPEMMELFAQPYLKLPAVMSLIFATGAGVIPLIEELLKPAALWLWVRRRITPREGFTMGLICGAAFALLESLGILATASSGGWALLVFGRMGTALLHMTTTALVGWGLASAWSNGQYNKLGMMYFIAVTLHSLWNIFSLMLGLSPFLSSQGPVFRLGQIAPLALGVLMLTLLTILNGASRRIEAEKTVLV